MLKIINARRKMCILRLNNIKADGSGRKEIFRLNNARVDVKEYFKAKNIFRLKMPGPITQGSG